MDIHPRTRVQFRCSSCRQWTIVDESAPGFDEIKALVNAKCDDPTTRVLCQHCARRDELLYGHTQ